MPPTKTLLLLALFPTLALQTGCCTVNCWTTFGIDELLAEAMVSAVLHGARTTPYRVRESGEALSTSAIFARPAGPYTGMSVVGTVTVGTEMPSSAFVYVYASDASTLLDPHGRYYLSTQVPDAACEGLTVTATLVNPPAQDVTLERSLGSCGDHEVDFRFD